MKEQAKREIEEMVRESSQTPMNCCLCSNPADMRGVFCPTSQEFSEKIGAPKGKTRVVVYPICQKCMRDPFAQLKAEEWMLKKAATQRN